MLHIKYLKNTLGWQSIQDSGIVFFFYGFLLTIFGQVFLDLEKGLPETFVFLLETPLAIYPFFIIACIGGIFLFIAENGDNRKNALLSRFAKASCRVSLTLGAAIISFISGMAIASWLLSFFYSSLSGDQYLDIIVGAIAFIAPFLFWCLAVLHKSVKILVVGLGFSLLLTIPYRLFWPDSEILRDGVLIAIFIEFILFVLLYCIFLWRISGAHQSDE